MKIFKDIDQILLEHIWYNNPSPKKTAKTILGKKKMEGLFFLNFKLYQKAVEIKTAWCYNNDRLSDQWNRNESLKTDS